jgi:hypothetical protein
MVISRKASQIKKSIKKKGADSVLKASPRKRKSGSPVVICEGAGCGDGCKSSCLSGRAQQQK